MPTVCVGCGLTVVGGILAANTCGVCTEADVGVTCNADGCIDFVIPTIELRVPPAGVYRNTASGFPGPFLAKITHADFATTTEDSSDGILNVLPAPGGQLSVLCSGVYALSLTGGITVEIASTNQVIGGYARIYANGTLAASTGFAGYVPADFDLTPGATTDGPEWNCSTTIPLAAASIVTWEVICQDDTTGATIIFPQSINIFNAARLGSVRA